MIKIKIFAFLCALVTVITAIFLVITVTNGLQQPQEIIKETTTTATNAHSTVLVTTPSITEKEIKINFLLNSYTEFNSIEDHQKEIIRLENYARWLINDIANLYIKENNFIDLYKVILKEYYKTFDLIALHENQIIFIQEQERLFWEQREKEYPVATTVWLFMKNELGWSDIACAGALGNMMAEVGGQTLELDYDLWDESGKYYGICQWVDYYCPEVMGTDLQYQLDYLKNTVEYNMNEWNVPYENFLNATIPEEAALLFAMGYERCNTKHYYIRTINAMKAYEYYTSDTREYSCVAFFFYLRSGRL